MTCSHIGGLLHKVEIIVRKDECQTPACTEELCTWKASNTGVEASKIADIQFYGEQCQGHGFNHKEVAVLHLYIRLVMNRRIFSLLCWQPQPQILPHL